MPDFDWERPLKDLHELAELTGGPDGARRLAWSEDWRGGGERLGGQPPRTPPPRGGAPRRDPGGAGPPPPRGDGVRGAPLDAPPPRLPRGDRRRRLPYRRRAAWRLARRLPRAPGRGRGAARSQGRRAGGHLEAGRLGRRGGRAFRAQPARLIGRRGHPGAGRGPPP